MEFIELMSINKLDGVILKYPHHDNVDGTVCITGHHLILSSRKEGVRELWLLHKNIDSIEKKETKVSGGITQGGSLFLKCKDLRIFQLDISSTTELNLLMQTLENLLSIQDPTQFYPFFYRHMHPIMENGYTLYSVEGEFTKVLATEEWRISRVNQHYTVCPAYPKGVVVPKTIDDETLAAAATFRQGGRFPVLSYRHNNGAVLLRAGQPLYGPKHRRCRPDEAILNTVVSAGMKGVIYDLRSSNAILQQQNKGGGSESPANYSQWKIYNRSMDEVDNQQQLLENFSKLVEACVDREISSDKWLTKLESCGWPESVRNSLHTACIVAQHIHQLLHKNIDSIEKKETKVSGGITQGGSLFLKCKDLRIFQLDISSTTELNLLMQTLENLLSIQDPTQFYPFFYRHMHPIMENGYTLYSVEGEFTKVLATEEWRISRVNQHYTVCPAYPKGVVVPKTIDDETLAAAATFRQGGRFPVLSYRHNNGAVLLRAGQPLYGPKHRRCRPDEAILNTVVSAGMKGVIYDLRSSNAILQQQNKGGGSESPANYSQWKIYNRSMDEVDNQQQLLENFSKLVEACVDREISSDKWLTKLESCGWPESVRNSLHTACIVAQHIHQKAEPVLIHGTRGEDATLLVCSLVQIILNPDCRTIRGLQALIEREWLQAGHPFGTRLRSGPYSASQARSAPTFPLFLDCVRQFLEQFPCSFEYRQGFLVTLFEHAYSSQFGTFLCDSDEERETRGVYDQTTSIWSWINQPDVLTAYINPLYDPTPNVIWPSVAPMSFVIWEELYLRWLANQHTEEREEQYKIIRTRDQHLRAQALQLRRELLDLANQYYAPSDK